MKKRIKTLQEKEYYLKEKFEQYEAYRKDLSELKKAIELDKKGLLTAAKRLEEDVRLVEIKNSTIEKEKEIIIRKFQEYENDRSILNNERVKLEQLKSELKLRMQTVDLMRVKYVSNQTQETNDYYGFMNINSNMGNTNNFNQSNPNMNLNMNNNAFMTGSVSNNFSNTNLNNTAKPQDRKQIKSDEFFENLKNKLENPNAYLFDHDIQKSALSQTAKPSNSHNNFNNYLNKEMEQIKKSNLELEMKKNQKQSQIDEISIKNNAEKMDKLEKNSEKFDKFNLKSNQVNIKSVTIDDFGDDYNLKSSMPTNQNVISYDISVSQSKKDIRQVDFTREVEPADSKKKTAKEILDEEYDF